MPSPSTQIRLSRIRGTLIGTAIGDALGFYVEGLSGEKIEKNWGKIERFLMPGGRGFLSDDTEQTALVAEALALCERDPARFEKHLRSGLVKWFWTLPPGIGKATAQACLRMTLLLPQPGVRSAGNGSAMRAAIIGIYFFDDGKARQEFGTRAAKLTHTDERAISGALFVAELAAQCMRAAPTANRFQLFQVALTTVSSAALANVLQNAKQLAEGECTTREAAKQLGTTGFVLPTLAFASFCFLRFGDRPMEAISQAISGGNDTDSIAAILGAWLGALHGDQTFPAEMVSQLVQGPVDLDGLSEALATGSKKFRRFSYFVGLLRNILLIPVIFVLAVCRLWRTR